MIAILSTISLPHLMADEGPSVKLDLPAVSTAADAAEASAETVSIVC
jgi:hypothetical protein